MGVVANALALPASARGQLPHTGAEVGAGQRDVQRQADQGE